MPKLAAHIGTRDPRSHEPDERATPGHPATLTVMEIGDGDQMTDLSTIHLDRRWPASGDGGEQILLNDVDAALREAGYRTAGGWDATYFGAAAPIEAVPAIPKLEDLKGWVEYDVCGYPPDHPDHHVAPGYVSGPVRSARPGESPYPHPYKDMWNPDVGRFYAVTQEALDSGTTRPVPERSWVGAG